MISGYLSSLMHNLNASSNGFKNTKEVMFLWSNLKSNLRPAEDIEA